MIKAAGQPPPLGEGARRMAKDVDRSPFRTQNPFFPRYFPTGFRRD
jgi:hypothetical protein